MFRMLPVELLITTAGVCCWYDVCVLMLQLELFNISQQHNSHHPTIQTFFCIYFNDFARFCRVFAFQCFINQYLVIFSPGISLIIRVITTMQVFYLPWSATATTLLLPVSRQICICQYFCTDIAPPLSYTKTKSPTHLRQLQIDN